MSHMCESTRIHPQGLSTLDGTPVAHTRGPQSGSGPTACLGEQRMLHAHKPMCSLKWSYSGSHQGVPASECRTSTKPQTSEIPTDHLHLGLPHRSPCSLHHAQSGRSLGRGRCSTSPSVPTVTRPAERPSGGPLGLPEPHSEDHASTACGLCGLPSERHGCVPTREVAPRPSV